MGLDKPPPSRYSIEEKDGRLIVHDSMAGDQVAAAAPAPMARSALGGASVAPSVAASHSTPSLASPTGSVSGINAAPNAAKAKRGATVAVIALGLVFFLLLTGLWPMVGVAMLVPPVRKRLLSSVLPAVKRYIAEGRVS